MRLEKTLGKKYVTGNNCEFYIELVLDFKNDELELEQMQKMCADEYSKRAKNQKKYHMGLVTRVGIEKSLKDVPASRFRQFYTVPPDQQELPLTWKVELKHDSAFVAGNSKCIFSRNHHFMNRGIRSFISGVKLHACALFALSAFFFIC